MRADRKNNADGKSKRVFQQQGNVSGNVTKRLKCTPPRSSELPGLTAVRWIGSSLRGAPPLKRRSRVAGKNRRRCSVSMRTSSAPETCLKSKLGGASYRFQKQVGELLQIIALRGKLVGLRVEPGREFGLAEFLRETSDGDGRIDVF